MCVPVKASVRIIGTMKTRLHKITLAFIGAILLSAVGETLADSISGELFYTRFEVPANDNVRKLSYRFDGTTFTTGTPVTIGTTNGADGIAGNVENFNLLIVGGQGKVINTIDRNTGATTETDSPVDVFHVEIVGESKFFVFGSGIPGSLVRHPILSSGAIGAGVTIPLTGDDTLITQLITTPTGFFYTSSDPIGSFVPRFGTLSFTGDSGTPATATGATTTRFDENVLAAHGGVYDPFTDTVFIMGGNVVEQRNATTGALISRRSFSGGPTFDQGTVDGKGHLFVADNNLGRMLFMDYGTDPFDLSSSSNFASLQVVDPLGRLDDIAPLVGAGSTLIPLPTAVAWFVLAIPFVTGRSMSHVRRPPASLTSGQK